MSWLLRASQISCVLVFSVCSHISPVLFMSPGLLVTAQQYYSLSALMRADCIGLMQSNNNLWALLSVGRDYGLPGLCENRGLWRRGGWWGCDAAMCFSRRSEHKLAGLTDWGDDGGACGWEGGVGGNRPGVMLPCGWVKAGTFSKAWRSSLIKWCPIRKNTFRFFFFR